MNELGAKILENEAQIRENNLKIAALNKRMARRKAEMLAYLRRLRALQQQQRDEP